MLIVPYGIETQEKKYSVNASFVLIVPYGIETVEQVRTQLDRIPC